MSTADCLNRESGLAVSPEEYRPDIAIVLHLFYDDHLDLFLGQLANIQVEFDCFVSVGLFGFDRVVAGFQRLALLRRLQVKQFPNVGRDMAPLFAGFGTELLKYELVLKLHGKKSSHSDQLKDWLSLCLHGLVGSPSIVQQHLSLLSETKLGIISVPPPQPVASAIDRDGCWGDKARSFHRCYRERERLGLSALQPDERFSFPVGSMFWCKPEVLKPLMDLNLRWTSFDREAGQLDGTLAHALERLVGLVCTHKLGLDCRTVWPVED
ncbi:rhamnan synthesis F family protein [Synechococcus sp. RS9902]|uniref:rhamnan synthesis F family protein n=1 Tax=Synechococcus sp. RS9902 TaxID=221345 RepID=UPI001648BACB|nr:rhamnan synthesis F family protein [Synechococcus sp. RS9902]QNI96568.1 glycosyltransferase/ family 4 [Synechococcus sp. RS9902]